MEIVEAMVGPEIDSTLSKEQSLFVIRLLYYFRFKTFHGNFSRLKYKVEGLLYLRFPHYEKRMAETLQAPPPSKLSAPWFVSHRIIWSTARTV